jgi:hypothetical protein
VKDFLAGWTGMSVALPKVAADDIPVLPEGVFRPIPLSHAPKGAGASGKPLPMLTGMALCPAVKSRFQRVAKPFDHHILMENCLTRKINHDMLFENSWTVSYSLPSAGSPSE